MPISINVTSDISEPLFADLVQLLARYGRPSSHVAPTAPAAGGAPLAARPTTAPAYSDAEVGVSLFASRIGPGSAGYLRYVVRFCEKNGTLSFNFGDIAAISGLSEKTIRAHHRNVHRALSREGFELFTRSWDGAKRRQQFHVSADNLAALRDEL
jgi:hypothetical protein